MFKLKQHNNRMYDNRVFWHCPKCNIFEVSIHSFPEKCDRCEYCLPPIKELLEQQTARVSYHLSGDV